MLRPAADWATLHRSFRWQIPVRFNIAASVCDRHADPANRLALIERRAGAAPREVGFLDLERQSCRLANVMAAAGIGPGDRVAILLPQRLEVALAHLAIYRLGAIALPLFTLFGPDALQFRLADSGAAALITDPDGADKVGPLSADLPGLRHVWLVDRAGPDGLAGLMARAADRCPIADTLADDPALLIYTSGTTGQPKGALHGHRVLLGHLPGVQVPHGFFPQPGDRFWTPADWAWIGGLLDVLLPSLHFGVPVVAGPGGRFDPEAAADFMAREGLRNAFLPPTALRLMRQAGVDPGKRGARLRTAASGGERLGDEVVGWGRQALGVTIDEFYGQTECNLVVSTCRALFEPPAGSMGRAVPGHRVAVLGPDGQPQRPGDEGEIAIRRPDPVMFLGYWNQPDATRAKFRGDWLLTGDLGRADEAGNLTYLGRDDDVITSAGYRIGPAEIEATLLKHPAVALCAVIGVPDPARGEVIKAFVVPRAGVVTSAELGEELRALVRARLAAHETPRQIAFVDELPLTTTGKVMRRELRSRAGRSTEG
jgi:acetyl-CoA synthetase